MAELPYNGGVPTVTPDIRAPDDAERISVNPEQFAGAVGQGLQQAGQGILKLNEFFGQSQVDDQINKLMTGADTIRHGDPNKTVIGPDGKPTPDTGFLGLQGADALQARASTQAQLDALIQAGRNNLSTPEQQLQFDSLSRRMRSSWVNEIGDHADKQARTWAAGVNDEGAQKAALGIASNPNDNEWVAHQTGDLIQFRVRQAQLKYGDDPDIRQGAETAARGESAVTQVEALLNQDPLRAKQVLEGNRNLLNPQQYDSLVSRLRPMIAGATAPEAIQRAATQGPLGPVSADQVHASIIGQESGGRPDAATSITGAKGIGQIEPGTFRQYAKPGESINSPADNLAVSRRITDDYYRRYNGDPARVAVAYFSGPGNVAPAGSPTPYLQNRADPTGKTTASYVSDVTRRLGGSAGMTGSSGAGQPDNFDDVASGLPDKGLALFHARQLAGDDPIQARMNISEVNRRYAEQNAMNYTQRMELQQQIPDYMAAAAAGVDGISLPEDQIRRFFPPAKAEQVIGEFQANQAVGSLMRGAEWASPQDLTEMQRDISSGQGVMSDAMRAHRGGATTGPGTTGATEDSDELAYFRLRETAARRLNAEITHRNSLLVGPSADPASYVANNPAVKQAAAAVDTKNPATIEKYAQTSLGIQSFLGVPEGQQHVLLRGEAMGLSNQIMSSADPTQTFKQLQSQYGNAWPRVFGDAVSLGRLPPSYQAVQMLEDPHDAALLSRTLAAEKPGPDGKPAKSVDDAVEVVTNSKGEAARIRDAVRYNSGIQDYANSITRSGASPDQVEGIVNSVQTLALAKRENGEASDSASAAAAAVKSFFGIFDYLPNGGARVPAKDSDVILSNAKTVVGGMTPDAIAVPPSFGGLGQPAPQEYVDAIKAAPTWVTSPKSDALWLMDTGGRIVRGKDGQPVSVPFNAGPIATAAPPPPQAIGGIGGAIDTTVIP